MLFVSAPLTIRAPLTTRTPLTTRAPPTALRQPEKCTSAACRMSSFSYSQICQYWTRVKMRHWNFRFKINIWMWPCYFGNRQAKHEGRLLQYKISKTNLKKIRKMLNVRRFRKLFVRSKIDQILICADAIDLVQISSKSELSSWFFGRLKILTYFLMFDGMKLWNEKANYLFWRSYDLFDVAGRCASKNDPLGSEFQLSTILIRGVKESVSIFCFDFWPTIIIIYPFFFWDTKQFCSGVGLAACWAY